MKIKTQNTTQSLLSPPPEKWLDRTNLAFFIISLGVVVATLAILDFLSFSFWSGRPYLLGDNIAHWQNIDWNWEWLKTGQRPWADDLGGGWSPSDRYYFMPFLMINFLRILFIPVAVAHKLIVVLPIVLIPTTIFWAASQNHRIFPRPIPGLISFFSVLYLFQGVLLNTATLNEVLISVFSWAWSVVFSVIAIGIVLLHNKQNKTNAVTAILPGVLLAAAILSHPIPAGFAFLALGIGYWFERKHKYYATLGTVAVALSAFWWIPFLIHRSAMVPFGRPRFTRYSDWGEFFEVFLLLPTRDNLIKALLIILLILGLIFLRKSKIFLSVIGVALFALLLSIIWPDKSLLWHLRFLPLHYYAVALALALAVGTLVRKYKVALVLMPFLALIIFSPDLFLAQGIRITGALGYNENSEIAQSVDRQRGELNPGRVIVPYSSVSSLLPFAHYPFSHLVSKRVDIVVMNNAYLEMSSSNAFIFIASEGLGNSPVLASVTSRSHVIEWVSPDFQPVGPTAGKLWLKYLGARYFAIPQGSIFSEEISASTDSLLAETRQDTSYGTPINFAYADEQADLLYRTDFFELPNDYYEPVMAMECLPERGHSVEEMLEWWRQIPTSQERAKIFPVEGGPKHWPHKNSNSSCMPAAEMKISNASYGGRKIDFVASNSGPAYAKVSWHPNWRCDENCKGPWRGGPGMMLVEVTGPGPVSLRWSSGAWEYAGESITGVTLLGIIAVPIVWRTRKKRHKKRSSGNSKTAE